MKRMLPTALVVKLSAVLLALGASGAASAATEAYIDCSLQSNACFGDTYSDTGPVTVVYQFDYAGIDAIFPADCTDQTHCNFSCPRYPGPAQARLLVFDTNFKLVKATEWVAALCTQEDILLPGDLLELVPAR